MKPSIYNFYFKKDSDEICFNAMSRRHFRFSSERREVVKNIIDNPDNYRKCLPVFYDKLKTGNFIVDDDIHEPDIVRKKYDEHINAKYYKLVIIPTLQCNFRCWYCIQQHIRGRMGSDMVQRICKHIEYMIIHERIESLLLDWFGGEPFLYFSEIIQPISDFARAICKTTEIPFYSSATTNGFLMRPEIVDQIQEYNFLRFQITLDGDREHHNKIRTSKKYSSFDEILKNINYMCSKLNCKINLRVNYDDKNLNPENIINQTSEIISQKWRKKIGFTFRRVWQVKPFDEERELLQIGSSLLQNEGYNMEADFTQNFVPCYASRRYYNTISFNGNVYKCTVKDDLHNDSLGYLDDDGIIQWHIKDFERIYHKPLFDNEHCLQCKYLPICMGPCTRRYEENKLKIPKFVCVRDKVNGLKFEDSLMYYCINSSEVK